MNRRFFQEDQKLKSRNTSRRTEGITSKHKIRNTDVRDRFNVDYFTNNRM